jgi:hypothetical protein
LAVFEGHLPQNDKKFTQNGVYKNAEGGYDKCFCGDKEAPNRDSIPKHCAHAKSLVNCRDDNPGDEKHKHLIELVWLGLWVYDQKLIE